MNITNNKKYKQLFRSLSKLQKLCGKFEIEKYLY